MNALCIDLEGWYRLELLRKKAGGRAASQEREVTQPILDLLDDYRENRSGPRIKIGI